MRKIIRYQCDFCGHMYDTEEEAFACEHNHKHKLTLVDFTYGSITDNGDGYPKWVLLEGEDGNQIWYTRE